MNLARPFGYRWREIAYIVGFSLLLTYLGAFIHEALHVIVNWAATGEIRPLPIHAVWSDYGIPRMFMIGYHSGSGWGVINRLVATLGTSLLGLALIVASSHFPKRTNRMVGLIAGTYLWLRFAMYGGGFFYGPSFNSNGQLVFRGDGWSVLNNIGPVGMIPALVVIFAGAVVLWRRVRNSADACGCSVDYSNAVRR